MGNPKRDPETYQPDHYGTQPRKSGVNKGKQMQMHKDQDPKIIKTKGK